jgi:hypothetical protein
MSELRLTARVLFVLCLCCDVFLLWYWNLHGWPWMAPEIDFGGPRPQMPMGNKVFLGILVVVHILATFLFWKSRVRTNKVNGRS